MPEGEGPVAGVVVVDRGLVVGEGGERPALVLGVGVGLTRMGRASGGLSKEAGAGEGLFVGMPGTLPCSCFHELNLATMSEPEKANEAAAPAASILFLRAGGVRGALAMSPHPHHQAPRHRTPVFVVGGSARYGKKDGYAGGRAIQQSCADVAHAQRSIDRYFLRKFERICNYFGRMPNNALVERLVVDLLTRLHRYVRDSGAAPAAFFEAYDPLTTGAISIPAFRSALSAFHVPHFCLSTNDMEVLASHYSFGGDPSMISYLSLLDDMSKTPHHLESSWRKASTNAFSSLIRLEKLERLRSELCMLQQKKLAIIAGLALQADLCQPEGFNSVSNLPTSTPYDTTPLISPGQAERHGLPLGHRRAIGLAHLHTGGGQEVRRGAQRLQGGDQGGGEPGALGGVGLGLWPWAKRWV